MSSEMIPDALTLTPGLTSCCPTIKVWCAVGYLGDLDFGGDPREEGFEDFTCSLSFGKNWKLQVFYKHKEKSCFLQKYRKLEFFICYLAKVAQNYSVITVTGFFRYLVIKKLRRKPFFRYYSEFRYLGFRYSSRYLYWKCFNSDAYKRQQKSMN